MFKKIGLVIFLYLIIMNMNYGEIKVVDIVNLTSGINGHKPIALCVLGTKVYVANYESGSISVLENDKNIDQLSTNSNTLSYPNPFNPECYIAIESVSGQISAVSKIKIYNILGQVVRKLNVNNGSNSIYWDGRDNFGKEISSWHVFL